MKQLPSITAVQQDLVTDKDNDNNYKVIEGNIDNDNDGIIDGCENAYYNGTECDNL